MHQIVHDAIHGPGAGDEFGVGLGIGARQVVMQVAVADVAKADDAHLRKCGKQGGIGARDEFGDARDRHGDVVLDRDALDLLRLGNILAQGPQRGRLRLAGSDRRVSDDAVLGRALQRLFQRRGEIVARAGKFDQRLPCRFAGERVARARNVSEHQFQRGTADDLEGRNVVAGGSAQPPQQADRRGRIGHGHPGRGMCARTREELQGRRRNQSQRAFGADEEMLQIVAGVVLAQGAQAVPDAAVGQHHFEAEAKLTRIAVAQHLHPAGIGREVAADGGAAFRRQRQRKQAIDLPCCLLYGMQGAAGLDRDRVVVRVDGADAIQARERDHHFAAGRRRAAAQAGIAALRHDGRAGVGAGAHHGGDFFCASGQYHAGCAATETAAPVGAIGCEIRRPGQDLGGTDDGPQAIVKVGAHDTAFVALSWAYRSCTSQSMTLTSANSPTSRSWPSVMYTRPSTSGASPCERAMAPSSSISSTSTWMRRPIFLSSRCVEMSS